MEELISFFLDYLMLAYGRLLLFGGGLLFSLAGLLPFAVVIFLIWAGVSAAHRRQQRARCFIDLLEIGLKQGRSVEETILSLSERRVRDMGVLFHLLAAWMERGLRLSAALAEVPRFLPKQVAAMLRVGEELGDVRRVLPVCRASLQCGASNTQKNLNTLVVLLFVSPVGPALIWALWIWVIPKFEQIVQDMTTESQQAGLLAFSFPVLEWSFVLANGVLAVWLIFFVMTCFHGLGAWLFGSILPGWFRMVDALSLGIPWRRRRVQRNFSALLALLLDAGVTEERSLRLAAEGTGNGSFLRRAERAVNDLRQGVKLPEAIRWLDGQGEFAWRLRNACHTPNRFVAALTGWQEALEAKAFQQEQLFSQAITTSFVLVNGVMVGLVTVGIFQALVSITELALW